jgi:hypothetical protein
MTSTRTVLGSLLIIAFSGPTRVTMAEPSTPQPTAQQIYDQALADLNTGDWPAAIKGFASIAKPPDSDGKMSQSQGVIHAQLARAYARHRETEKALREAALAIKGLGPDDNDERGLLWLAIGDAERLDLAVPQAAESYQKSLEAAQEAKNAELIRRADIGLALGYMTVDPGKARTLLDAVLAMPEAASDPQQLQAQLNDLRGRASLNLGQAQEAIPFLNKAVKLSGGLAGTQVSLVQIAIRGDAAIGALLTRNPDGARKYLAWTGAGHLPSEEWNSGLGDPPVCSEAAGIHPDDMVVVEFSITADGHVVDALPIYASRPGDLGVTFARSVKTWRWNPERIAMLPPFWRRMLRIEMRCISRPNPKRLEQPFVRETLTWLSQVPVSPEDLAPLKDGYVTGDDPRLERDDVAAIPALMTRLRIEKDRVRAAAIAQRLSAALDKARAPAAARAVAMNMTNATSMASYRSSDAARTKASQLAALERADPNSAATAWLTLEYAIALEYSGRFKDARPVLERVVAFPLAVLDEHDPVRDVAILHLAALQRRAGDAAGADSQVNAAGLTRAQCMLFDVRPVATNMAVSAGDFPYEARRWGFDGFVREGFDINAEGHVENVRAVIAYPPFVFRSAADHMVARYRFLAPVVDGGAAGCDGHAQNINFRLTN